MFLIAQFTILGLSLLSAPPAHAGGHRDDASPPTPPASVLFQISRLVEWPDESVRPGPFVIGVTGSSPAVPENFERRFRRGRLVIIRRVQTVQEMRRCHLLFFDTLRGDIRHILAALSGARILTVANIPGFSHLGGMIELGPGFARPRLLINAAAVRRSGLSLDPSLLHVAAVVRSE